MPANDFGVPDLLYSHVHNLLRGPNARGTSSPQLVALAREILWLIRDWPSVEAVRGVEISHRA
jgi:hypothetical protein